MKRETIICVTPNAALDRTMVAGFRHWAYITD